MMTREMNDRASTPVREGIFVRSARSGRVGVVLLAAFTVWLLTGGQANVAAEATQARANAYDNYGPTTAGHAMCRGNPDNSASMPGGTATQSFTVAPGVTSLDAATVNIDPDASVTAHATLRANGAETSADATAAGDTVFAFSPLSVHPGDQATLELTFTATSGKITTVYTVGNPGGSFSTSNSCPAGASNDSSSTTGLRAVVSGSTAPAVTATPTPPPPTPIGVYFAPYKMADGNRFQYQPTGATALAKFPDWDNGCQSAQKTYNLATKRLSQGRPISTLAGWSYGRIGVINYLSWALGHDKARAAAVGYVLLLDPGSNGELHPCDSNKQAGKVFADWLTANRAAHFVILSDKGDTQSGNSKGIKDVYFKQILASKYAKDLRSRVLVCNYTLPTDSKSVTDSKRVTAHQRMFKTGKYYIEHHIGLSTKSCPRLSESGHAYRPTYSWHPSA